MAELTVAAVGLVGLASLFETCVNSVSYIKIARSFSADYQSLSFELELVQSRLYRWLEAVDISNNADFLEDKLLRSILANILNTLEEVRKVSSKYASEHSVAGPDAQQDDSIEVFRAKIADIIAFRQKSTSLVKKTTWALYHKEHFDTLISDTSRLVTQLIELFPASQARQTQLCAEEVLELSGGGDEVQLKYLQDASSRVDELMSRAAKMLSSKVITYIAIISSMVELAHYSVMKLKLEL